MKVFHAFTDCDVVSSFATNHKSSAWDRDMWLVYLIITGIFVELSSSPGEITQEQMDEIQQYVVFLYARISELSKADDTREVQKNRAGRFKCFKASIRATSIDNYGDDPHFRHFRSN
jgi:hypothetical protein